MFASVGAMARTQNTDKIQKLLKEEERQAKAAGEEKKHAGEKKAADEKKHADEKKAAEDKKATEEAESAEEEKDAEEEEEDDEEEAEDEDKEEESDGESACGDPISGGRVSSRKRSASESSEELHYVPSVKKHHKSWG
jgi:hypothetical protein